MTGSLVRLVTLTLVLTLVAVAQAGAASIPLTSVEGFPNGRTSNDPPTNAIDGNLATFTWTTEANNAAIPSYLAVGFASTQVNRLRLTKLPDGGGGQNVKNLAIQYTTGTGPLSARSWSNVPNLRNGFRGSEILRASAVKLDGTVLGDVHSGTASLTFDRVQATGLRVAFANPSSAGTCSSNPTGPCNHYRVGELQAFLDAGQPRSTPAFLRRAAGGVGIAARGPLTKILGQRVTLTARARSLPPGGRIVILGVRADGTVFVVRTCPVGVLVCTQRAFSNAARTVRFVAVVRRRGVTLRRSRFVTVTWRARTPTPTPTPTVVTPRLVRVLQDGPTAASCTAPLPTGGGSATATLAAPYGTIVAQWSMPSAITPGAVATLNLSIRPAPGQRLSGNLLFKPPSEFGASAPPFDASGFAEVGQTYDSGTKSFTFTPARAFVAGEVLYIRVENICTALHYEYVAS